MPAKGHALLSASSAGRWLHCPPSARLGENYEDTSSEYAAEGTDAHALGEYKLLKALKHKATNPTKKLKYYSEEMEECTDGYRDFVMEQVAEAKKSCSDAAVLIEQRVNFSRWVQEGFGTADTLIVSNDTLTICDYKHGKGVAVEATDNAQLKCYALGALDMFEALYDVTAVQMIIYQPRRENVSIFKMSKDELYQWAEKELKPKAELAFKGEGKFACGEWCRFCKAKHECRARAEANILLAQYDFRLPPTLEDSEIEVILDKVDELVAWATDIKEYALQKAVSGKAWKDWKLVEGRSNRKYVNEQTVADMVKNAGFDPFEHKILGITAMTKLLGKTRFEELLSEFIEKPQGKPTLVPMSDKRPAMNTAANDFKEDK